MLSVELLQISGYQRYLVFQLSCSLIRQLGLSYLPNSPHDSYETIQSATKRYIVAVAPTNCYSTVYFADCLSVLDDWVPLGHSPPPQPSPLCLLREPFSFHFFLSWASDSVGGLGKMVPKYSMVSHLWHRTRRRQFPYDMGAYQLDTLRLPRYRRVWSYLLFPRSVHRH